MAPIASYLGTALVLIQMSLCAPVPQEIAHQDQVLAAIAQLKSEITDDPKGITKSWGPSNGGEEKHHKDSSSNNNNEKEEQKKQDDYYQQQQQQQQQEDQEDYYKQQEKDQEDYWKQQQKDQSDWQQQWWKDYYNGKNNNNNGYPQPPDWPKPGAHGLFHSSGDHSSPNWNNWPKSGCPDPTGINC